MIISRLLCLALFALVLASPMSHADYYGCHKKIYAMGWFKKYEFKGETWHANTKKSGAVTSTGGVLLENITSSTDPGVTSGRVISTVQYSSSWGECAAIDSLISMQMRDEYIAQNLGEIKKQVASGYGHHINSLTFLSGCDLSVRDGLGTQLRQHTAELYDSKSAQDFRLILDEIISTYPELEAQCHTPSA